MNSCQLMGRPTKDPEIRYTQSNTPVATFVLAVDRRRAKDKEPETDFLPVVAWRNHAEFASKYIRKGQRIAVTGSIQTRHYDDKDGKRQYVTEIIADNIDFADGKQNATVDKPADNTAYNAPNSNQDSQQTDDDGGYPF
ncbi:single-stranded DNA-binding protein [Clostridia bacterium]|nr:single-stranded DNA-binding protein [Clostridia bacterium]